MRQLTEQPIRPAAAASPEGKPAEAATQRVLDAVLFVAILAFSAIAMVAVALAAPLALAFTAIAGAFSTSKARGGWRVAEAS